MSPTQIAGIVFIGLSLLVTGLSAGESDPVVAGRKVSEWKTTLAAAQDKEREQHLMNLMNARPLPLELMLVCIELLPTGPKDFPSSRQLLPLLMGNICEDSPKAASLLLVELDKGSDDRRLAVLSAVCGLRDAAKPVVPMLLDFATNAQESKKIRCASVDALARIKCDAGQALPRLMTLINHPDKDLAPAAIRAISAMRADAKPALPQLVKLMQNTGADRYLRAEAAEAIGAMGSPAKSAIPAMIEFLREVDAPCSVAKALGMFGADAETAVPVLIMKLKDRNSVMIGAAARALGNIGAPAISAVPELIRVIKEAKTLDDRRMLTGAIGNLCADAQDALPLLINLMANDNWDASNPSPTEQSVMKIAACAWWEGTSDRAELEKQISPIRNALAFKSANYFYAFAPDAVPVQASLRLARALPRFAIRLGIQDHFMEKLLDAADKHSDEEVRANAKVARAEWKTKKMVPLPPAKPRSAVAVAQTPAKEPEYGGHTLTEWIAALKMDDTRIEAEMALPHLGAEGIRAVLRSHRAGIAAGLDLSQLNEAELKAAAPAIIEALSDKDVLIRRPAPSWIEQLPPDVRKSAISALIKALDDEDVPVRRWAAQALGNIGPDARDAVPQLIRLFQHPDRDLRWMAMGASGKIGPAAKEAVPLLIAQYRNAKNDSERSSIPLILGGIGPVTPEVLPLMLEALKDPGHNTRNFAAQGIGKMKAKEAIPQLIAILKNPIEGSHVRNSAAEAMGNMGPNKEALAPLAEAARDPKLDWESRGAVMNALIKVDADGATALKALQANLEDADALVLIRTAEVIGEMGSKARPAAAALGEMIARVRDKKEGFTTARLQAVEALGKIGANEDTIKVLESAMTDPDTMVSRVARETLRRLKQ